MKKDGGTQHNALYLEGCHGNLPIQHTSRRIFGSIIVFTAFEHIYLRREIRRNL